MFLKDFKEQWSESRFVANLSEGKATALYFQMMLDPMFICSLIGFLMLGSNERWFGIFQVTVGEFFQFNGTKLSLYTIFFVGSICAIFHKFSYVQKYAGKVLRSINQVIFGACSIISGVFVGLAIPAFLSSLNFSYLNASAVVVVLFGFIALFSFYSVRIPKIFSEHNFHKNASIFIIISGLILLTYCIYGVFWGETWILPT
ncbi:hypothetical protein [Vibrio diabolicus]|uniref:hypothetical protein n=1 Tax=Vibrio diabolicus TaxID=50719 RepID=UPI00142878BF|nr:hypothetical protein [Vibrio diabolicus]QIR97560.1 hypothetical protein FR741_07300 [Vibrio diabolicus]